jgi:hypothetical protein
MVEESGYPIIFAEAGIPGGMGGRNHWADDDAVQLTIDFMKAHPQMAHYLGFEMAKPTWSTSLVIDNNYNPSSRGLPYYNDLRDPNSPAPTRF